MSPTSSAAKPKKGDYSEDIPADRPPDPEELIPPPHPLSDNTADNVQEELILPPPYPFCDEPPAMPEELIPPPPPFDCTLQEELIPPSHPLCDDSIQEELIPPPRPFIPYVTVYSSSEEDMDGESTP